MWAYLKGPKFPERVEHHRGPPILLTGGPFAWTRNPMYLGFLMLWLGWALWYGSVAVGIGLVTLAAFLVFHVPHEERGLEARFGEAYLQYKSKVPRWLGRTSR
jgi:protein-S-isoprenylcysteine O-methyltransferase Ste14